MGRCRFVQPDTKRLEISDGDWLLVKKRLSQGEREDCFARKYISEVDGARPNLQQVGGLALVTAYLLDWSLLGLDEKPVPIRGQPIEDVEAALKMLDPEDFKEIRVAIENHEAAMQAERDAQKKILAGAPTEPKSSPSLVAVAGGLSG